jgi:PAS domain S-box-containing protein
MTDDLSRQSTLRMDAEMRLSQGVAPRADGWEIGVETLALLYRLACNPATAGVAVKVLHELQVHQVEMHLQQEQLENQERERSRVLRSYRAFFDLAPTGYLVIRPDGRVVDANPAGAKLLGLPRHEIRGGPVENLFAPESRVALVGLLNSLRNGSAEASRDLAPASAANGVDRLRLVAHVSPAHENILIAVSVPGAAQGGA